MLSSGIVQTENEDMGIAAVPDVTIDLRGLLNPDRWLTAPT